MNTRTYILIGVVAAFIIINTIVYCIPSTEDLSPHNPLWNGLAVFALSYNATIVSMKDIPSLNPVTSTLFMIGFGNSLTEMDIHVVKRFISDGGIIIISDEGDSINSLLRTLNINVSLYSGFLADPLFMYKNMYLPRAVALVGFRNSTIYLNYASAINISDIDVKDCIAKTSVYSFIDYNFNGRRDYFEPYGPFCVAYVVSMGRGALYVVSDSSIFINSMIHVANNTQFVEFLTGGRKVYIVYEPQSISMYTRVREAILGFHDLSINSWFRYPIAFSLICGLYIYIIRQRNRRTSKKAKNIFSKPFNAGFEEIKEFTQNFGEENE